MNLTEVLVGVLVALQPFLILLIRTYLQQKTDDLLRRALGEGAARVAGQILVEVPAVRELASQTLDSVVDAGVELLQQRFPDTVKRFGVTPDTLRGMVKGELGKILAPTATPAKV